VRSTNRKAPIPILHASEVDQGEAVEVVVRFQVDWSGVEEVREDEVDHHVHRDAVDYSTAFPTVLSGDPHTNDEPATMDCRKGEADAGDAHGNLVGGDSRTKMKPSCKVGAENLWAKDGQILREQLRLCQRTRQVEHWQLCRLSPVTES
jgi:hypothetical protein